jgi:4-hydroxybenzoate polyprenyltransferase
MRLSLKAAALAFAVLWAASILVVGLANTLTGYGHEFLQVLASLYPGYKGTPGIGQTIIGALYGAVDAAIGGALFAWLYNLFVNSTTNR